MKSPREILLERHRTIVPKLDDVCNKVVVELNRQDAKAQSRINLVSLCLGGLNKIWLELIWPCRRIWSGLGAIWILLFIFDFSQRDPSELMAKKYSPSPEMILTFRQQERLLAELIGPDELRATEPPKVFSPQPRSERRFEILMT